MSPFEVEAGAQGIWQRDPRGLSSPPLQEPPGVPLPNPWAPGHLQTLGHLAAPAPPTEVDSRVTMPSSWRHLDDQV